MDKIEELLTRRVAKIYPSKEALEQVLRSGKKIRLYQGFDPSSPNLHIGHLVGLLTLKSFQALGHEVIFLIGDYTGMVGDPTGKSKTRNALTLKQVRENAETYKKQTGMILSFSGKNPIKIKFNSHWLAKLNFGDVLKLAARLTVQQLIERDMFQQRLKANQKIYFHEFMYPLMQGYDSVAMKVDLEIGGSDQMFNMMVGRKLVKKILGKEKFVLTTQLLADSQGNKIGKTEGNTINLKNPPVQFFGQIMSLSDQAIIPCLRLITELPLEKIETAEKELKNGQNPMAWKKQLAFELVKMLYDEKAAHAAQQEFEKAFQKHEAPETFLSTTASSGGTVNEAIVQSEGFTDSNSQLKRMFEQKAIDVNQKPVVDPNTKIKSGDTIRYGKHRFIKVK